MPECGRECYSCRMGGVIPWYTLSPEQPVLPRPAGEAPFSIYYCRKYFEVEMVGPEWTLSPGGSRKRSGIAGASKDRI